MVPYKSNDNVDDAENIENGATLMIKENLLKEQAGEDVVRNHWWGRLT